MDTALTKNTVKMLGRTKLFGDTLLLSLSGSGIEFEYTGEGLTLTFIGGEAALLPDNEANYARIGIYVNQDLTEDFALNAAEITKTVAKSNTPETSVIRIMKLSECAMSLVGIKPIVLNDGETIKPTPNKDLKIEFIGDSITCGYGVEDPDPLHDFKTLTENVTKAFAYKTATNLNADFQMFSISGYGIISGYTDDPTFRHKDQLIPDFYESMGLSYDEIDGIPKTQDIPWDFSEYKPDIIVLNLGTNDDSFCQDDAEKQAWFSSEYTLFLKKIREKNPNAKIICVLGLMGDRLFPAVCKGAADFRKETGDDKVYTLHLPEQDPEVGYGANYHPLESEHRKVADVLVSFIKNLI